MIQSLVPQLPGYAFLPQFLSNAGRAITKAGAVAHQDCCVICIVDGTNGLQPLMRRTAPPPDWPPSPGASAPGRGGSMARLPMRSAAVAFTLETLAAFFSCSRRLPSKSSPVRRPKSSASCSVIFRQAPSSRNTSTRPFLWADAWTRSIRIFEVVCAHIHRPACRLGGDAGLVCSSACRSSGGCPASSLSAVSGFSWRYRLAASRPWPMRVSPMENQEPDFCTSSSFTPRSSSSPKWRFPRRT